MRQRDTFLQREILQIIPSPGWRAVYWGDEGEPLIFTGAYFALTHIMEFETTHIYRSAVPLAEQPLLSEEKIVELHIQGDYFHSAEEDKNFHSCLAPGEDMNDELRAELIGAWKMARDNKEAEEADRRK